jgi:hypothetical protein
MLHYYTPSPRQIEDWHRNYTLRKKQPGNVMNFRVDLPGNVDIAGLTKAYEILIKRHEVLRTFFPKVDGQIRQQVEQYDGGKFGLLRVDSDDPATLLGVRKQILSGLKNLKRAPLFRGILWKSSQGLHFIFYIHHIISDQWSIKILKRELASIYGQISTARGKEPDHGLIQLGRYFEENRERIEGKHLDNLEFWRRRLADKAWHLDFDKIYANCLDQEQSSEKTRKFENWSTLYQSDLLKKSYGQLYSVYTDPGLLKELHRLRKRINVSMYGILIASLHILGSKLTGNRQTLIPTHFNNRHDPGTDHIIGNLLGTVFLHNEADDRCTVKDFIVQCYASFLASIDKIIYSSEELECLQLSTRCLLHFNFISLESTGPRECKIGEPFFENTSDVISPLFCEASEYNNTIIFKWGYNLKFFDAEVIRAVSTSYFNLLRKMVLFPDKSIIQL